MPFSEIKTVRSFNPLTLDDYEETLKEVEKWLEN